MKVYVAAKFFEKRKVKKIYNELAKTGHKITVDWTWHQYPKPFNKNIKISKDYSIEDLNGVLDCDVLFF